MHKYLSDDNQLLLHIIATQHVDSLKDLEDATGRDQSDVSSALEVMEQYGFVKIKKIDERRIVPKSLATAFDIKTGDWEFMYFDRE